MNAGDDVAEEDFSLKGDVIEIPDEAPQPEISPDQEKQTEASSEILLEFLEVAVHQILYARKLYPEEIFLPRKKYNVPVHISSHPGLNQYISSSLASLKKLLLENRICHISILVKDGAEPVENFRFEINVLRDTLNKEQHFVELEQGLRSFVLKILVGTPSLHPLPETCGFEIVIGCTSDCEVDLNINDDDGFAMRWTIVDKADFARPLKPDSLIPIKALTDSSVLNLQLVIEKM